MRAPLVTAATPSDASPVASPRMRAPRAASTTFATLLVLGIAPGCYLAHERPSDAATPDACGTPDPGIVVRFEPALPGAVHAMPVTLVDLAWDPAGTRWRLDTCAGAGCPLDMILVGWHVPNPIAPFSFPGPPRRADTMSGTLDWDGTQTAALRIGDARHSRGGLLMLAGAIGQCCDASLTTTPPGHACTLGCGEITAVLADAPSPWATRGGEQHETCPADDVRRSGIVTGATYEFSTSW